MNVIETGIAGVLVLEPRVFKDARGYFMESFRSQHLADLGIENAFIQDNESQSTYGVLRGLHYQVFPFAQTKLVRVVQGEVLDVAVDIRPGSTTYGKHVGVILSAENKKQLLIPAGFAHGYAVLSKKATFVYKCDAYYSQSHEGGIRFDDPNLGIDWKLPKADMLVSDKDWALPYLGEHINGPWHK